jgi:hypothetical protein
MRFLMMLSFASTIVFFILQVFPQTIRSNLDSLPYALSVDYGIEEGPWSVYCVDLKGDNDLDLAVVNVNGDNFSFLKNNGDGTFASAGNYRAGDGPYSVF